MRFAARRVRALRPEGASRHGGREGRLKRQGATEMAAKKKIVPSQAEARAQEARVEHRGVSSATPLGGMRDCP